MLAVLGFLITGCLILAFAFTFQNWVAIPYKLPLWQYISAYYCLAAAFLFWGYSSILGGHDVLGFSVLVGDGLLMVATLLLLSILVPARYTIALVVLGAIGVMAMLAYRALQLPPAPYIHNGLLIFNSPDSVKMMIGIAFSLVWLPANVRVVGAVTAASKQRAMHNIYMSTYVAAVLSSVIFLFARRDIIIILSFIALGVTFLVLNVSNYTVKSLHHTRGVRHG